MLMKRDETMQNMNYYYDFSGQKFEYPLSLSINQFDRQVFSRQSSLENLPLSSKNHENYMKAILFIDQHYQEDIHLEDVAQNLSFSISYD